MPEAISIEHPLTQHLAAYLANRLKPGDRLAVALSGGQDSVVLTDALLRTIPAERVLAVHVNHGLHQDAARWSQFCVEFCQARRLAITVHKVEIDPNKNVENAARQARYDFFKTLELPYILLAHHAQDQAETLLFRLLRGTGSRGSAAMPEARVLPGEGAPTLLRPFLTKTKAHVQDYADSYQLNWLEDPSNQDEYYSRNWLRHRVLPQLQQRYPHAVAKLAQAAQDFADHQHLLEALGDLDWRQAYVTDNDAHALDFCRLQQLGRRRTLNALITWLAAHDERITSRKAFMHWYEQCLAATSQTQPTLRLQHHHLIFWQRAIYLERIVSVPHPRRWQGERQLPWGAGYVEFSFFDVLSVDKSVDYQLSPVFSHTSRFATAAHRPSQTLKKIWQGQHVPPWRRRLIPALYRNDQLIWLGDLGFNARVRAPLPWQAVRWHKPSCSCAL